jgi:molecular chaperone HscC
VSIKLSLGTSKSSSTTHRDSSGAFGSTVAAGKDLTIVAQGAGKDSDITVTGSNLSAANNVVLKAEGDIVLQAARNAFEQKTDSKSSSASAGIGYDTGGQQNGWTVELGASVGRGKADGRDESWTNSNITAGNVLAMQSGGDTTLKGAAGRVDQIIASVGGNLLLESLQDSVSSPFIIPISGRNKYSSGPHGLPPGTLRMRLNKNGSTFMIIGIDLGTTNSLVALWQDGKARLVANPLGSYLTPSCVSLDEDGSVLVGQAARERRQTHPERTAALFKRHMGSDKSFVLGGKQFRAEELSSLVLRALKADAEAVLGHAVTEAVISVPAYFSDTQRKATRNAGELAGLKVERLVNEPTAAALAYGLHQSEDETQFLVFDLGGGTFDVSVLELFEGVMEVRATAGDNFLGGEDFVNEIVQKFFETHALPGSARDDRRFMQQLLAQAESAKRQLSTQPNARIALSWQGEDHALELSQDLLAQLSAPLLTRLRMPVERSLRDANIKSSDIATVVLAGGATRMPLVRQLVTRMFGRFPNSEMDPDQVVAAGAAVMAGLKMKDQALEEVVMTDVCPYTLGISTTRTTAAGQHLPGQFSPIIERNTIVPVSREETYAPIEDGQSEVELQIYQGESRLVRDNILLGTLRVPLPRLPRHESAINVRFTYDVNGLLEVEAALQRGGAGQRVVIQGGGMHMGDADIQRRLAELAELKIHPREHAVNRALLAQAERIYQMTRGHDREVLANEIALFEQALETQEERTAARAGERLRRVVDILERAAVFAPGFDPAQGE